MHSAREFVNWYNGHPDFKDRTFDLSGETAVIIGHGNVAIDCARILCSTMEELEKTVSVCASSLFFVFRITFTLNPFAGFLVNSTS